MYAGAVLTVRPRLERLGDSEGDNSLLAVEQMFWNSLTPDAAEHCRLFASLTRQAEVSVLLESHLQKHSSLCARMAGKIAEQINYPSSMTKHMSFIWYFHSASIQEGVDSSLGGTGPSAERTNAQKKNFVTNAVAGSLFGGIGLALPTAVVSVTTLVLMIGGAVMINL